MAAASSLFSPFFERGDFEFFEHNFEKIMLAWAYLN
jgi:hypothetical protein